MIVMLAVFEGVAVLGLLFFFIGMPPALFLRFAAATAVLHCIGLMRVLPDFARAERKEDEWTSST